MSTPPPEEEEEIIIDQEKISDEALQIINSESFQMRKAIDENKLRHSLKYAKNMLDTLKNPYISPSNYYQIYIQIFDQMQYLYAYFKEEARRGRRMKDLYDTVQQCENIIPRIFLLITVGSVYIEAGQTTATEVIFDLLSIIKGVQNPLRGLFCRYFLLKMIKDKLPDKGNEFEKQGASFEDTIKFILTNLNEMNSLWIRLNTGASEDRNIREKERNELKILVGENITRLSSLNGMSIEIYQKQVLPKVIETLLECADTLSQFYLLECVIHAFPDEYNIHCMNTLLETCTKLQSNVDVKALFIALMEKLARYVDNSKDEKDVVASAEKIFELLKTNTDKIIQNWTSPADTNKLIELQVAFMKFTIKCAPEKDKLQTINYILSSTVNMLSRNRGEKITNEGIQLVGRLLSAALESPLSIFEMPYFPELMKYLDYSSRSSLSLRIIDSLVNGTSLVKVDSSEKISTLIDFIRPLLEDSPDADEITPAQFEYEQQSVCKIMFIIKCTDPSDMYEILSILKNVFIKGGINRMKYTLPSLINAYITLAYGVSYAVAKQNNMIELPNEKNKIALDFINQYSSLHNVDTLGLFVKFMNKIYNQINDSMNLISHDYPEIAFKLYMNVVTQINDIKIERGQYEDVCYNSLISALQLFSSGKIEPENKVHLLSFMIGTVLNLTVLGRDSFIKISSDIVSAAQTLMKRSDQCIAILGCVNLFFNNIVTDKDKINDCLTKAKRFADFAMTNPQNAVLFIYILNKYLYLIEKCESEEFLEFIKIDNVNDLFELVKNHIQSMKIENKDAKYLPEIEEYYNNVIATVNARKQIGNKKILEQFLI